MIVLMAVTAIYWRISPVGLIIASLMCGGDGLAGAFVTSCCRLLRWAAVANSCIAATAAAAAATAADLMCVADACFLQHCWAACLRLVQAPTAR